MKSILQKSLAIIALCALHATTMLPITLSDVRTLYPFGKTDKEINQKIKALKLKNISVANAINDHFDQKEKNIITSCKKSFPALKTDLNTLESLLQKNYTHNPLFTTKPVISHKPNDHILVKRTREIIASFGMNPQHVTIITDFDNNDKNDIYIKPLIASASTRFLEQSDTYINILCINLNRCQIFPIAEFDGLIAHECMHLWYGDRIRKEYLWKTINTLIETMYDSPSIYSTDEEFERLNSFKNLISNNCEMRCDIIASLYNNDYGTGLYSFSDRLVKANMDWDDSNHPSFQERCQAIKQLNKYLEKEKTL